MLAAALRTTDFPALDPDSTYGLQTSILFQIEHVTLGPLTYEQGGRRVPGVKGLAGARAGIGARGLPPPPPPPPLRAVPPRSQTLLPVVPSWAKTADGREWQDDLLRRLGARLVANRDAATVLPTTLTTTVASSSAAALVPLVFVADVHRLELARLGSAGGTECYLLGRGREYPCRTVVVQGWVLDREYSEKDNAHVYSGE